MGWEPAYLDILAKSGIIRGTGVTGGDGAGAQRDNSILFRTTLRVSAVIYNKVVAECQN